MKTIISSQTQCLIRETDDLSYLRPHRDEKRYHEKSTTGKFKF